MSLKNKKCTQILFVWSTTVILITCAVLLAFIAVAIAMLRDDTEWWAILGIQSFIWGLFLYFFVQVPLKLEVDNSEIIINKVVGKKVILRKDITAIQIVDKAMMKGTVRTFGSGGVLGYLGTFCNSKFGNFTMYATEYKNLVYIETSSKKYVISCCKAEWLVEQFSTSIS